jgi:hypothetical protein
MTCIVAVVEKGTVYIGADSAGIANYDIHVREDTKVFKNGPFVIGATSSFRLIQLLHYKFVPPVQECKDDMEYMCVNFIDSIKKLFKDDNFGGPENKGGNFLLGYKGKLYEIEADYQVGVVATNYNSVGIGSPIALGSLYSTQGKQPIYRINKALEAAAHFSAGVVGPFRIVKVK